MREVLRQAGIVVLDDVLPEADFQRLRNWSETVQYQGVHHHSWRTVWRHGEGEPLRGPNWVLPLGGRSAGPHDEPLPAALRPLAAVLERVAPKPAPPPRDMTVTPWIYPSSTALGLHVDDDPYEGSYIYYTVPEWDVHWGGLLHCIADPAGTHLVARGVLDLAAERRSVAAVGHGSWVGPGPNRLVLVEPQVRHFISRVDQNAGDRPRTSIAGFFRRA